VGKSRRIWSGIPEPDRIRPQPPPTLSPRRHTTVRSTEL